ncbi:MAG: hypothetical protein RhofKO_39750 [Rhodothermales bacterium]
MPRLLFTILFASLLGLTACDQLSLTDRDRIEDHNVARLPPANTNIEVLRIALKSDTVRPTSMDDPIETGWPAHGQTVRWEATLWSGEQETAADVVYRWRLCGRVAEKGDVVLSPGNTSLVLETTWDDSCDALTLDLLANNGTRHDMLPVRQRGLSVGFFVEEDLHVWMEEHPDYPSFERWARQEVDHWNNLLENHADAPIQDRLRLDQITIIPNSTLQPSTVTTDLSWTFSSLAPNTRFLRRGSPREIVENQVIVLHELLHQRGLRDLYAYDVQHAHQGNGSEVRIMNPDGTLAAGSLHMPFLAESWYTKPVFLASFDGVLMGSNYRRYPTISVHSAFGLNLVSGRQTPRYTDQWGNRINPLVDNNPYTTLVPRTIRLAFTTPSGDRLANHAIDVFLDIGDVTYRDIYAEQPTFTLTTGSDGVAELSGDWWSDASWYKRGHDNTLILRARTLDNSAWGYAFLPTYHLNMAYIRGDHETTTIPLRVAVQ